MLDEFEPLRAAAEADKHSALSRLGRAELVDAIVGADAGHGIGLTQHVTDAVGGFQQQRVADPVAVFAVDVAEAAQVHHHHAEHVAELAAAFDLAFQTPEEGVAVGESGQRITVHGHNQASQKIGGGVVDQILVFLGLHVLLFGISIVIHYIIKK